MNERGIVLSAFAAVCMLSFTGAAEEASREEAAPLSMSWKGYLQTDHRISLSGPKEFTWQEYRLDLRPELKVEKKALFYSEFWIRNLGFSQLRHITDLQKNGSVLPMDISFRKAYVEIYDVGITSLDLTIGRQRIVWGTADKINPTDNLDPDDLEDIWDMGRHLGSDGLKAQYYLGKLTLTTVYLPIFRPAVLPSGNGAGGGAPKPPSLPQMSIHDFTDTIIMPELKPMESSSAGFKAALHFTGFDASLSYAYCRDDIPLLIKTVLVPQAQSKDQAISDLSNGTIEIKEAKSTLMYPRLHIAGVDMAGMVGRLGLWGEAAFFFSGKTDREADRLRRERCRRAGYQSMLYTLSTQVPALKADPYMKFVVGADFTLPLNTYINAQYVHGFTHERGDSLEDYVFFTAEWKLFNNKLKVSPFGVILEIKDYNHFNDAYALVDQPQITWRPVDNAEIQAGVRLIDANPGTYFDNMDNNEAFLRVKYGF